MMNRAHMFVKFGMDTEQMRQPYVECSHSLAVIKKVEYKFRNRGSIAYVTVFITRQNQERQSYCSSLMIDS